MKVIITGGGGFLGQVLAREILSRGSLRSETESSPVTELILADVARPAEWLFPVLGESEVVTFRLGDVSSPEYCESLVNCGSGDSDADGLSIFHLGAVMSGTGEADFDLAIRVNLRGTMNVLEAARKWHAARGGDDPSTPARRPTVVFTSAGAVIGSGHESDWVSKSDVISDSTRAAPHTTYGTTKACCELLLSDYSRRNFLDGRGVRLPAVVVRAGEPNAATTSCFSSVVREPLGGRDVVLPIDPDVPLACTGYRAAVGGMLEVHDADPELADRLLGFDRTVFLPSRSLSLGELAEATLAVVASPTSPPLGEVRYEVDDFLSEVVGGFPTNIDAGRALQLGAPPTPEAEMLVREYCEDFPSALAPGLMLLPEPARDGVDGSQAEEFANGTGVVALVTGGGSGIGRAVAVRLAVGGWGGITGKGTDADGNRCRVGLVLAGRRAEALRETAKLCETAADEAGSILDVLVVPTDVTREEQVESMFRALSGRFGRLDLLFNNAGINIPPTSVEDVNPDDWRRVVDVNLTGCWLCARGAMKIMGRQGPPCSGGRIVNNGSISAYSPRPMAAPYTATKHAVLGLTKSIALDGRRINVACGQIDFGNVTSDLTANMATGMPQADGSTRSEPTFSVEDAARAVHTMASLPPNANVLSMTIMATNMPYVGRG